MMYSDEDVLDYKCVPPDGRPGHLVRFPKGLIPTRCPVMDRGRCESVTFIVIDPKTAARERAGIRSLHRNDAKRYDR